MIVSRSLLCRVVVVYDSLDASLRPPPYFFVHRLISPWALEKTSFLFSILLMPFFFSLSHFLLHLWDLVCTLTYFVDACTYPPPPATQQNIPMSTPSSPHICTPIASLFFFFSSLPGFSAIFASFYTTPYDVYTLYIPLHHSHPHLPLATQSSVSLSSLFSPTSLL
ncbi:hypothetical protein DFP72DRAFT_575254 [Ephemerocybe angulata]|uniref:Uncharacterized protein n=1 Tax=Ephemerocybe angulata TaxID=980116 RepID=A0A8H6M045_9AGAR|nr:hypothetical protein DFP72DRAFT_575254 [Tulosesus angulatus]